VIFRQVNFRNDSGGKHSFCPVKRRNGVRLITGMLSGQSPERCPTKHRNGVRLTAGMLSDWRRIFQRQDELFKFETEICLIGSKFLIIEENFINREFENPLTEKNIKWATTSLLKTENKDYVENYSDRFKIEYLKYWCFFHKITETGIPLPFEK